MSIEAEIHHTACPLDCPDNCSLDVEVRQGRVERIEGSLRNSLTQGFICSKVRRFDRRMYGDHRLMYPILRRGARGGRDFERISWPTALELLADRIENVRNEWGGEAILPLSYGGSNGYVTQDTTDARLFRRLRASRLARTVCAAPSSAAARNLYGSMPGVALEDYVESRLIVVWGVNPSVSGIHLIPIIREAQKRGARLVVVDPVRTPLAAAADLHLAVRPGSDLTVALAIIRWLFETGAADLEMLAQYSRGWRELRRRSQKWSLDRASETSGIDAVDIERFAAMYASSSPAVIRCGWGVERNRNGGSAVAAILALPAVAGKFGVRGGGYTMSQSGAWRLDTETVISEPEAETRIINMNRVGEELLSAEPPVKLLFVYNANPLVTLPEQAKVRAGLEREDLFTVVFDQVMTDTARYADLVLPATTFLEHRELSKGYGALTMQDSPAVIDPVGEARPNVDVFADLCRLLGLDREGEAADEKSLVASLLRDSDRIRTELAAESGGVARPDCGARPVQLGDVFPGTSDGRIDLVPETLDGEAPRGLYGFRPQDNDSAYPLTMISPSTSKTISSTLGELVSKRAAVELHPDDANDRGIRSGERVRVHNQRGEVRCRAHVTTKVGPGVVSLAKGLWFHSTDSATTSNVLVTDELTDIGGGACFNDARVEIERLNSIAAK